MGYFKDWWKSLFSGSGETDELGFPVLKRESISEPVQTLVRLFKNNPKRFKFEYDIYELSYHQRYYSESASAYLTMMVTDLENYETLKFTLHLTRDAVKDKKDIMFYRSKLRHKYYPILGYVLTERPNWITDDEVEYFKKAIVPHFLDRVNRYREIVNYRKERKEESHKRKTELDKKKERERLVNAYKGE